MKRHNFAGLPAAHGAKKVHRQAGSTSSLASNRGSAAGRRRGSSGPAGTATTRVTIRNLAVVRVDAENNLLLVRGGIPGLQRGAGDGPADEQARQPARQGRRRAGQGEGRDPEGQEVSPAVSIVYHAGADRPPRSFPGEPPMDDYQRAVEKDGFAVVPGVLPPDAADRLADAVEPLLVGLTRVQGGVRDVLGRVPAVRELAGSNLLRRWVEPILGADCVAVNATLFDKADGRNWKVPYHQDVTIRLRTRADVPGFGPWWEKAGVPHVWPPAAVIERMLAVRVHLDDCGPENGPLRVIARVAPVRRTRLAGDRRIAGAGSRGGLSGRPRRGGGDATALVARLLASRTTPATASHPHRICRPGIAGRAGVVRGRLTGR